MSNCQRRLALRLFMGNHDKWMLGVFCSYKLIYLQVDLSKSYIDLGIYSYIGRGKVKLHCGEAATATHGRTDRKAGS